MLVAVIREAECVGCTKCLPACPVDAIVGASKFLHSVLTDECIGCGLCIAPCPMDCIEMQQTDIQPGSEEKLVRAERAKKRFQARQTRLIKNEQPKLLPKLDESHKAKIRSEIQSAVARVNAKREQNEFKKAP